jgi:L-serine deaminase
MRARAVGLVLTFIAGAGVMAAVAVAAGWWHNTSTPLALNTDKVARSIQASILSQRHIQSTVNCPHNIIQKAGVVFECDAAVHGRTFEVFVTETDGDGHVVFVVT